MKRLLLISLLLTSCEMTPEDHARLAIRDGQMIKSCPNGTRVYEHNGVLAYYNPGGAFFDSGSALGLLPKNTSPKEFCG